MDRGAPLLRLGTALGAVLLLVSACGSEDPPEGPLGGSGAASSETPSAAASQSPQAVPPPPAATDDEKGREAFARWFVEAFAHAFGTNDPTAINRVAAKGDGATCRTCELFTTYLRQREADGGTVIKPSTYTVKQVFPTGRDQGVYFLTLITDRPAFANVKADGTVVKKFPADPAYPIEVSLRYHHGAYELTDWTAGKKKP